MDRFKYLSQLDSNVMNAIIQELINLGLSNEDIKLAMNSRLIDLEDTIDIEKFL